MTNAHNEARENLSPDGEPRLLLAPETEKKVEDLPRPEVLIVDTERILLDMVEEWFAESGYTIAKLSENDKLVSRRFRLVIVDVPYPRHGADPLLRRIAQTYLGTPLLALSSNFFPGIECEGAVAKALGVDGVLSKPVTRDTLMVEVKKLVHSRPSVIGYQPERAK
jgi:CheY-like chemotaxis protein